MEVKEVNAEQRMAEQYDNQVQIEHKNRHFLSLPLLVAVEVLQLLLLWTKTFTD